MWYKTIGTAILIAGVIFLSGCGGDGGKKKNNDDDSTTITNHPPAAHDDTASAIRGGAAVTINVLVNDTDSNGDTLSIKSGSLTTPTHGGTVTISSGKITYTPPANYSGTETFDYTVTDGHGGEDTATVTVTIAKAWGNPVLIGDGNTVDAKEAKVAALPNGDAIAVWLQDDGAHSQIRYSRYTVATGTWSAADTIAVGDSPANSPQVAVDSDGNILAVWTMMNSAHTDVMARYYNVSASSWGGIQILDTNNYTPQAPQVAFESHGNAFATWRQGYDGSHLGIYVNRFSPATGWGGDYRIDSGANYIVGGPDVAFDGHDFAFVVWAKDIGSSSDILACRYDPNNGWGSVMPVENDSDVGSNSQLAVDKDGNAYVVWEEWDGSRRNIFANRYAYGNGWETPTQPLENSTNSATYPQITVDGDGRVTAIWTQGNSVNANTYIPGSGWSGREVINSTAGSNPYSAQISANAAGDTVAIWWQWDGSARSIFANSRPEGSGTWGTAQVIENMNNNAGPPQITVDADGNAVAVWEHSDGSHLKIYANRFW